MSHKPYGFDKAHKFDILLVVDYYILLVVDYYSRL